MTTNLLTTSGRGVQGHIRTTGCFQIRYFEYTLSFAYLEEAYQCFLDIEDEVTLWDMTETMELLESKACIN